MLTAQSSPRTLPEVTVSDIEYIKNGTTRVIDHQFKVYRWPSQDTSKFVVWQDSLQSGLVQVSPMFAIVRSTGGGDINIEPKAYTHLAGGVEITGEFGPQLSFWMRFHNNSIDGVQPGDLRYPLSPTRGFSQESYDREDPYIAYHNIGETAIKGEIKGVRIASGNFSESWGPGFRLSIFSTKCPKGSEDLHTKT